MGSLLAAREAQISTTERRRIVDYTRKYSSSINSSSLTYATAVFPCLTGTLFSEFTTY